MAVPRNTTWFLYCKDGATNESVAEALRGLQSDFSEHECTDGKKRFLYRAPDYAFTVLVTKSKGKLVQVFRSKSDRKPEPFDLEILRRWRSTPRNIQKESDAIKKRSGIISSTINKLK